MCNLNFEKQIFQLHGSRIIPLWRQTENLYDSYNAKRGAFSKIKYPRIRELIKKDYNESFEYSFEDVVSAHMRVDKDMLYLVDNDPDRDEHLKVWNNFRKFQGKNKTKKNSYVNIAGHLGPSKDINFRDSIIRIMEEHWQDSKLRYTIPSAAFSVPRHSDEFVKSNLVFAKIFSCENIIGQLTFYPDFLNSRLGVNSSIQDGKNKPLNLNLDRHFFHHNLMVYKTQKEFDSHVLGITEAYKIIFDHVKTLIGNDV